MTLFRSQVLRGVAAMKEIIHARKQSSDNAAEVSRLLTENEEPIKALLLFALQESARQGDA